ncbi:hypothetical protein [Nonomuraea roseola]|uniref:Uncharacterized protein n=1 Tax=Nonomuraea roseola TaxID=46179 RepID=A0ABV5QFX4_9ACTN
MARITTRSFTALMVAGAVAAATASAASAQESAQVFQCGQASNGLSVTADSQKDEATACATALKVANAYLRDLPQGEDDSVTVTVDGTSWNCRQFQTAEEENEHGQCDADSGEEVRLYS